MDCTNNIAGFPTPCTKLVNIPENIAAELLEIDDQKIVLAEKISLVMADKNSPLMLKGEPQAKGVLEIEEEKAPQEQPQTIQEVAQGKQEQKQENQKPTHADKTTHQEGKNSQDKPSSEKWHKTQEQDLSGISVVGKNHLDISLISEYSRNIHKQLGKESNNPVITITDVARTPRVQAERMYSMLSKDGVAHVKGVYVKKVHSVIDIYASLRLLGRNPTRL